MSRYRYQDQLTPPAPFILVSVRNPLSSESRVDLPAQLDTAADRTVIPETLVRELALPRTGTITVQGIGGIISTMALHRAELVVPGQAALDIEVASNANEPWVLLGRDILNSMRIVLDGPQLVLEVG